MGCHQLINAPKTSNNSPNTGNMYLGDGGQREVMFERWLCSDKLRDLFVLATELVVMRGGVFGKDIVHDEGLGEAAEANEGYWRGDGG